MSDEKMCPFMFSPARTELVYIGDEQYRFDEIPEKSHPCERDRCMAWGVVVIDSVTMTYGCRLIP